MLHPENEVNLSRVARPLLHYLCGSAKCIQGTHARLIVPLICRSKVLSLGSAKKNEFFFCISLA